MRFMSKKKERAGEHRGSEKGANMYAKRFIQAYMKVVAQINNAS